jgi:hypothetical protein
MSSSRSASASCAAAPSRRERASEEPATERGDDARLSKLVALRQQHALDLVRRGDEEHLGRSEANAGDGPVASRGRGEEAERIAPERECAAEHGMSLRSGRDAARHGDPPRPPAWIRRRVAAGESRTSLSLKPRASRPDPWEVPTLLAIAAASAAGWISDGATRPVLGLAGSMIASLVVSSAVYLMTKRFFDDLRGGR